MKIGLALAAFMFVLGGAAMAQTTTAPPGEAAAPAPIVAPAPAPEGPQVTMHLDQGDIVITLDPAHAPKTAANFLKYVRAGYFNGIRIYRIEPGFIIQMGDINAKGVQRLPMFGPIPLETDAGLKHTRGAVALAHGDKPASGQSTWYIDLKDNPSLEAKPGAVPNTTGYAVFGYVTSGMDVADKIAAAELGGKGPFPGKAPLAPIIVKSVKVTREK